MLNSKKLINLKNQQDIKRVPDIQLKIKPTCMLSTIMLFIVLLAANISTIQATPTLSLSFYKNNGYGLGNDMSGLWTINTDVSSDVVYVEFYLDNQLQLKDTETPFSWQFDTSNYTEGLHTIKVVAYDSLGEQTSVERQPNFVGFPLSFVVGIIVLVVVVTVISFVLAIYRARRREEKERRKLHR